MLNFVLTIVAFLIALGLFTFGMSLLEVRKDRRRMAEAKRLARAKYNGLLPGDLKIGEGMNWRVICPDCGTYNVLHQSAGVACRHCANELLIVPEKTDAQGNTVEPLGVISRVTSASNNRVAWVRRSSWAPGPVSFQWAPGLFDDMDEKRGFEVNPPTDLDWENIRAFMPITCPSCAADPIADCKDCRRTGVRFVPLNTWRDNESGYRRMSRAGVIYLARQYGARTAEHTDSLARFHGHMEMGHSGYGDLVLEGKREPAEFTAVDAEAIAKHREMNSRVVDDENLQGRALSRPPRKP